VLGTKFKIVRGYKGSREIVLAVERGEADGLCGYAWTSLKTQKPDWIDGTQVNLLVQFGIGTEPELDKMKVPSIFTFTKNEADKQLFELLVAEQEFGRPFVMPPGTPADKLKAMRGAFTKTLKDPDFLAEAAKQKIDIDYVSGEEVQKLVDRLYATPKPVLRPLISCSGWDYAATEPGFAGISRDIVVWKWLLRGDLKLYKRPAGLAGPRPYGRNVRRHSPNAVG